MGTARAAYWSTVFDLPCWEPVTLWEIMEKFEMQFLLDLMDIYAGGTAMDLARRFRKGIASAPPGPTISFGEWEKRCRAHGLEMCADLFAEFVADPTARLDFIELQRRIKHEFRRVRLLRMPGHLVEFYEKPALFGEAVNRRGSSGSRVGR